MSEEFEFPKKENTGKRQKILIGTISLGILILLILTFTIGEGGNFLKKMYPAPSPVVSPTSFPTPTPVLGETIMVTVHGFVPEKLTVKKDTYINFANLSDTNSVDVESDDHPTHKNFPRLNIGKIGNGGTSALVKYDIPGTYTYHNHLNPGQKGMIVVQP